MKSRRRVVTSNRRTPVTKYIVSRTRARTSRLDIRIVLDGPLHESCEYDSAQTHSRPSRRVVTSRGPIHDATRSDLALERPLLSGRSLLAWIPGARVPDDRRSVTAPTPRPPAPRAGGPRVNPTRRRPTARRDPLPRRFRSPKGGRRGRRARRPPSRPASRRTRRRS